MGLVIEGTIALGERERGCGNRAPTATGDGEVQPGWPEFRFELVGFSAFNGEHIHKQNSQKSICGPEDEDEKRKETHQRQIRHQCSP